MSTFQTYDQVGIKEDVSDIIVDITPTDVPFSTMIGAGNDCKSCPPVPRRYTSKRW